MPFRRIFHRQPAAAPTPAARPAPAPGPAAGSLPGTTLQRALALGHRVGLNFAVPPSLQRSKITGYASTGTFATPAAILAEAFGSEESYRLKALPRKLAKELAAASGGGPSLKTEEEESGEKELKPSEGKEEEGEEEAAEEEEEATAGPSPLWLHGSEIPQAQEIERAGSVDAVLEGERRLAGGRKSEPIQSLIGSLGEMERSILGRGPEKSYEGGHLVGDQFLGPDSYNSWNLAPQARKLNNPYYKTVEGLLAKGAVHAETQRADPDVPIQLRVEVTYPESSYPVTVKELLDRQVITEAAAKRKAPDETLTFPRFVPSDWSLEATIDPKYQEDHVLPTLELTEQAKKATAPKKLARVPSQEHLVVPEPLFDIGEGKLALGGKEALSIKAQQHYPDPKTEAKGTALVLGALTAPPRRQTRLSEPLNILKATDREQLLDDLGLLSATLGEDGERDPAAWSAIGYYLTMAAAKGTRGRSGLLEAAIREYQAPFKKIGASGGKDARSAQIRTRLKQILFYDSYVKLSDEEKRAAAAYEDVEKLGAAAYQEVEQTEELSQKIPEALPPLEEDRDVVFTEAEREEEGEERGSRGEEEAAEESSEESSSEESSSEEEGPAQAGGKRARRQLKKKALPKQKKQATTKLNVKTAQE